LRGTRWFGSGERPGFRGSDGLAHRTKAAAADWQDFQYGGSPSCPKQDVADGPNASGLHVLRNVECILRDAEWVPGQPITAVGWRGLRGARERILRLLLRCRPEDAAPAADFMYDVDVAREAGRLKAHCAGAWYAAMDALPVRNTHEALHEAHALVALAWKYDDAEEIEARVINGMQRTWWFWDLYKVARIPQLPRFLSAFGVSACCGRAGRPGLGGGRCRGHGLER
jgi:hypothetical protein